MQRINNQLRVERKALFINEVKAKITDTNVE